MLPPRAERGHTMTLGYGHQRCTGVCPVGLAWGPQARG
jgi:hypothetical protein